MATKKQPKGAVAKPKGCPPVRKMPEPSQRPSHRSCSERIRVQ